MTWAGFQHCYSFEINRLPKDSPLKLVWCLLCCWLIDNFKQTVTTSTKMTWRHCNVYEAKIRCILPKLHSSGNQLPTLGTSVTYHQIISWLWYLYANKKSSFNIFATWIRSVIYARFYMLWKRWYMYKPRQTCLDFFGILASQWHDDVIKWKLCPSYWPFEREYTWAWPMDSSHKGPLTRAMLFSLMLV